MSKLKRKKFLKGLAAGTIALPFLIRALGGGQTARSQSAPGIISGKKYKWRMVTTWPPNFPVVGEGCNLFAKWVEEMSAGRMEIKVYGGGELVPALETFDAVRNNAAEIGSGASYYWAGKAPSAAFFTTIPFGMNAQQINAWMLSGDGLKLWEELYAGFGLIPMPGGNTGFQMGGWFNKEINSMADFKGLKMRMPGLGAKVLQKAGGTPVLLAGGEIFTGLERGVIDATEWIGPYHDYLMGFHQIAKYYYSPGWHETGSCLEIIVNKNKYEALPPDLQQIIRTASYRANHWMLSEFEAKNAIYLEKLITEENVNLKQYPKEVLAQLKIYTKQTIQELVSSDPFAKKVYENYRSFMDRASIWAKASEKIFYDELMS
ncbi:MAG TPA: TRAP transporter substrate-binding protein [Bacteroidetes bacterium]|nr:TRAP transporter substrate-binding protein [Bacteroidota bacterium]